MSRGKVAALLGLVDSDDEGEDILADDSELVANMAPARKTRGTAANRAQNATTRTAKTAATAGAAPTKTTGRKALADKPANVQEKPARGRGAKRGATEALPAEDEHDGDSMASDVKPKAGRGRPRAAKAPKASEDEDISTASQPEPATQPAARRGRKPKAQTEAPPVEPEIPETQPVEVEIPETQAIEVTELSVEEYDQMEDLPAHNVVGLSSVQRLQSHSILGGSRRPVAASDSELHEPSMRRRVGDLTRKYENLEAKYRDLREIGVKEAERNYDRLKKQSEEKANTANELIATLKAQLSTQTELAKESQRLRQQLEASQSKAELLQQKVDEAAVTLTGAKSEIKALSAKLAAARSVDVVASKVPNSAIKGNNANNRLLANAEAAAQIAQMKEDLYGDLTGLIVRGVKREQNGETYDCIQTGRNGTLHFKLVVGGDELTEEKFDEPQFVYAPQLDPNRDQDLIDMLPDYLVEEISFPQSHAARFYSRLMRSLTERLE